MTRAERSIRGRLARQALESHSWAFEAGTKGLNPTQKIATKTMALIKHDRILDGLSGGKL